MATGKSKPLAAPSICCGFVKARFPFNTPVKFYTDAPSDSLTVTATGIGIGTDLPDAPLHITRVDGTARFVVEETSSTVATRQMFNLRNNGGAQFSIENTALVTRWDFAVNGGGSFICSLTGTGGNELRVTPTGRFTVGPAGFKALEAAPNGNVVIAGALTEGSSRDIKENFQAVDCDDVLAKVVDLDITTWNYKHDEDEVRHMGPVAEEFREAFALGENDTTIAAMDKDGVALASIQALHGDLVAKQAKIDRLERELSRALDRLAAMEEAVMRIESKD